MSKEIDLARLKDPFAPDEIEWRVQRAGKNGEKMWALVLAYIDNRAIMDRLDEVCGPENWRNEYHTAPNGGVLCGLSIRIGNEWITKFDGADKTDIEATKGGLSNSMKRAGSQWGIGRYLYDLDEAFVTVTPKATSKTDKRIDDQKKGVKGFWVPPKLPGWALPQRRPERPEREERNYGNDEGERTGSSQQTARESLRNEGSNKRASAKNDTVKADQHWNQLSKSQQINFGKRFKDLADAIQWSPDYEDAYDWAERKAMLSVDPEKERPSVSGSTLSQIENCLRVMEVLARDRPRREERIQVARVSREAKSLMDQVKAKDKRLHAVLTDAKITFEEKHLHVSFPPSFDWQMDRTLDAQDLLEELTGLTLRLTMAEKVSA